MNPMIPEIAEAMWMVLNDLANYAGRVSGFIKRKRKLSGASFVQSVVFAYLANPAASSAELQQAAATLGLMMSRQGIAQRFSQESAECMKLVLEGAVAQIFKAHPVAVDLLRRFKGVYVRDSSTRVLPDSLASIWQGCGGSSSKHTQASVKLCVKMDLLSGKLEGPILQSGREHDQKAEAKHADLETGCLQISDLAYFNLEEFEQMESKGAYFLSRLKVQTHLFTAAGQPLDLVSCLAQHIGDKIDWQILLGEKHRLPCRLLAVRVSAEVAQDRRQRLIEQARDKGQSPSQQRLALIDWTIYISNVPSALLSVEEALVLGRSRWQIELLFKLWKSEGLIDESRSEHPWHILTEFYAKLIAMIIQHWLFLTELWDYPERSLHQASQVVKKQAFHLASVFHHFDDLCRAISVLQRCLLTCRMTRCKTKPHTFELWQQFDL